MLFLFPMSLAKAQGLDNFITKTEIKYDLPAGIIKAIIKVESNGEVSAINSDDGTKRQKALGHKIKSHGLMQVQMGTARQMGFKGTHKELLKPSVNVDVGAHYLRSLLDSHENNLAWSLSCYNSGPGGRNCKNKIYGKYVGKILNAWCKFK